MAILFGFDDYWGSPLIYSSNCRPGYRPSGVPQTLAFLLALCSWVLSCHGGFLLLPLLPLYSRSLLLQPTYL